MLRERDVQRIAAANGSLLKRFDKTGGRLSCSNEAYVGKGLAEAICAFATERACTGQDGRPANGAGHEESNV